MQGGSLSAFAKAREEIQLWPAATMAFYYTTVDSIGALLVFLVLILSGAITYKMHEALREILPKERSFSEAKNRHSRSNVDYGGNIFEIGLNVWDGLSPDSTAMWLAVVAGMVVNLLSGILLFIWLGLRLVGPNTPSMTAVGLFSLPLLMLAMMVSSVIWTS